jgi:uncharacterized protein (DUF952 family)
MAPPYILLECNVLDSNILILNTKLVSKWPTFKITVPPHIYGELNIPHIYGELNIPHIYGELNIPHIYGELNIIIKIIVAIPVKISFSI